MTLKRAYQCLRLVLARNPYGRARYIKKHNIMDSMGDNSRFGPCMMPLYPELIRIGDNVNVHKKAKLVPHDMVNRFLVKTYPNIDVGYLEKCLPIDIGNNVYISTNALILGGVKIGNNVLITAGTVVNSDIPDNSVVSGNPGVVVGKLDIFAAARRLDRSNNVPIKNQHITAEDAQKMWAIFDKNKSRKRNRQNNSQK